MIDGQRFFLYMKKPSHHTERPFVNTKDWTANLLAVEQKQQPLFIRVYASVKTTEGVTSHFPKPFQNPQTTISL